MNEHETVTLEPLTKPRKPWAWGYLIRKDRVLLDLGPITLYFWPRRSQWMRFWERKRAYRLWAQLGPVEIFWR